MRRSILALSLTSLLLAGGSFPFFTDAKAVEENTNDIFEPSTPYTVLEARHETLEEPLPTVIFTITERHTTWYPPVDWLEIPEETEQVPEPETVLTEEEIKLVARMTMAEAEGESELGQRLVIDTILNRLDSGHFPNTIEGVLFQPHQFSPIESGRWDRCWAKEELCALVREECITRQNYDCVFFQRGANCPWGIPLFKEGNHHFFSYKEV